MMLRDKSVTDLRAIAQSYGIQDLFSKDKALLIQAIEMKQRESLPEAVINIPKPDYDARLMTKPPSKKIVSEQQALDLLQGHIARGLNITFDDTHWYMRFKDRTDEGTLHMPLRVLHNCANKIMK